MSNYPVGIYLGPNDSSVAIWENNRLEIIPNEINKHTTPSVVSFTKNKRLVGVAAKRIKTSNPKNTIYGIREIIGKKYDDLNVHKFIKKVPFKIVKDSKTEKPKIIVEYRGETKSYYPEEIYAMIIEQLIQLAREFIGRSDIKEAIITVPSYYNYTQRQAIKYSAKICGLNVLKIVNEEIAVCYTYGLHNEKKKMNILVFNMRSNETNVSIVNLNYSIFKINGTIRDDNLGGNLFD